MSNIDAVIFDLDGTLLDSMYVWANVDKVFFERRGLTIPEFYGRECSKRSFYDIAVYTIELMGLDERPEEIMREWTQLAAAEYGTNVKLKENALAVLEKAAALKLKTAVCTSLTEELYAPALINNKIEGFFDAVVSSAKYGIGKEKPEIYIHTAELIGADPQKCVFADDTASSLLAAKKAGMKTVGIIDPLSHQDTDEMKRAGDKLLYTLSEEIFDF